MKIVAQYDFNGGKEKVQTQYKKEFAELQNAVLAIDAAQFKTKRSREKTMLGKMLFSPVDINKEFKRLLAPTGWENHRINCDYTHGEILEGYIPAKSSPVKPFRDMDFVKPGVKLGIEIQFGKYAFMVYNVCAKMTIFRNLGVIDTGIEIVPVKNFADEMSTGISYFEQFAWDLTQRGISDIDTPVLILGIDV